LHDEEREEEPFLQFTIKDTNGNIVNRVQGLGTAGLHRVAWNLRYPSFTAGGGEGPLVPPNSYTVSAAKRVDDETTVLGEPQTFEVVALGEPSMPVPDRLEVLAFQQKVGELQKAARGAEGKTADALKQVSAMKQALKQSTNADTDLYDEGRSLELKLLDAQESLAGGDSDSRRGDALPPSILRRIDMALNGAHANIYGPTKTHRRQYEIAQEEYQEVIVTLRSMLENDLVQFGKKLDQAGVPWTTGRDIPDVAIP
jgi:hypothetical protein